MNQQYSFNKTNSIYYKYKSNYTCTNNIEYGPEKSTRHHLLDQG